jgi:hypothetical protein
VSSLKKVPLGRVDTCSNAEDEEEADEGIHLEEGEVDPGKISRAAKQVFDQQGAKNEDHRNPIWQGETGSTTEAEQYKPGHRVKDAG